MRQGGRRQRSEMAHIFFAQNIREQLDNVTVQPNAVIDDTAPATWRPLPPGTPLYAEGSGGLPRVSDIRQATRLGDCYFLGSLASLVAHHPQFIRDSLQEIPAAGMPDGVRAYRGRMFLRDSVTRTYRAVWVSADDQLPFDHLGRIGAFTYDFRNRSHTAAWPAIWEKLLCQAAAELQCRLERWHGRLRQHRHGQSASGDDDPYRAGGHHADAGHFRHRSRDRAAACGRMTWTFCSASWPIPNI